MSPDSPHPDQSGEKTLHSQALTLRDLGKLLGVTHSTISRALQNSPRISLKRRQEIQEAAARLGYRPNAIATRLGLQRRVRDRVSISSEMAWVNFWPDPKRLRSFKEFDLYWRAASKRAKELGYKIEEFPLGKTITANRFQEILKARNIHGILIPPQPQPSPTGWETIDWSQFCVVRIGYSVSHPPTHVVTSNHFACGMLAIENMWKLGYKRLGFVAHPSKYFYFKAGFILKHMTRLRRKPPICTFLATDNHLTKLALFSSWIKKNRLDAILTDLVETRLMLDELGYRIPEDIGLAATSVLDGNATAGIDQHSQEIGCAAVETLSALLNHNQFGIPHVLREVLITGSWINGDTLPPRS